MSDLRSHIINEIRRLASQTGRSPGRQYFKSATGIRETDWRGRFWAKWSDALAEAGCSPNEYQSRLNSEEILRAVAEIALKLGRVPSDPEMMLLRRDDPSIPSSKTVAKHFKRNVLIANLWRLAGTDTHYASLAELLPEPAKEQQAEGGRQEGWVYLLKSGLHYKVGRSDTLERRVREVGVAMPDATVLAHAIRTDDPVGIEAYWHRRFADQRVGGEWFKLSRADVAAFKRRKFQ